MIRPSLPLKVALLALVLPVLGLTLTAHADRTNSPPNRGEALYVSCAQCHGAKAEGLESTQAPRLAGRESWFIQRQLEEFRRRQRGKDESYEKGFLPPPERTLLMHPVVDSLTRSDTRSLIAYLSALRPEPVPPARRGDANHGRQLYQACVACHGKTAAGNRRLGAPRLTEQPEWYLYNQLHDFRMGWRGMQASNPHVKVMRQQLDLDDKSLHDLTAFIVSLNRPKTAKP